MNKGTITTFVLSIIVFFAIGTVVILLITPSANPGVYTKVEYESLERNKYVYIPTKDISAEGPIENHEVDREYLNNLEKNKGYKPRKNNNNPFSEDASGVGPSNGGNGDGTVSNGSSSTDSASNNPSSPNADNNGAGNTNK